MVYFISIDQAGAAFSSLISAITFVAGTYASTRIMHVVVLGGISSFSAILTSIWRKIEQTASFLEAELSKVGVRLGP